MHRYRSEREFLDPDVVGQRKKIAHKKPTPIRPAHFTAHSLLSLQQRAGNAAVTELVRRSTALQRCGAGGCPGGSCGGEELLAQRLVVQRGEKWDAFWDVGPIDAWRAKKLADESLGRAQSTGLPGLHNGPADAWRHAYWNCRMAQTIGADQAKTIADNHEKHGGGPALENAMDLHNNAAGRACTGDCDTCAQAKLDAGGLRVIDSATGTLVPSTKSGRTPAGARKDDYDKY